MNIVFDDGTFVDQSMQDDISLFQNDEPYMNNQNNFGLYLSPFISENELNREDSINPFFNPFLASFEEQWTDFETKTKDNHLFIKNNSENYETKLSNIFTFKDIIKKFRDKNNESSKRISENLIKDDKIEKYENDINLYDMHLLKRKRNRSKNKGTENVDPYPRGRKKKSDESQRKHDKYSPDNIIKKIKTKLIENAIKFINKVINKNKKVFEKNIFKKIEYKYINQTKKDSDIELLNGPLKSLLLKDISKKFSNLSKDSNRLKLEKLMKDEKNNKTIMFVLNLPFREFIELFCLKKSIYDIDSSRNIDSDDCQKIMYELPGIESLLNKILKKNDIKFLSHFTFLLYNYEKSILIKKGRNSKISPI